MAQKSYIPNTLVLGKHCWVAWLGSQYKVFNLANLQTNTTQSAKAGRLIKNKPPRSHRPMLSESNLRNAQEKKTAT